jgi:hypothetical protein
MISDHIMSQIFVKNNNNVLKNTFEFYLIENLELIVSLVNLIL